jgi:hypothetical protein
MSARPQRVFISYSHQDEALKQKLRQHLAALEKGGLIRIWDDRAIPAGGHWEQAIRDELEAADLILLLISASFIDSDYCYGEEMSRAVQRHAAGQAIVVPVLVRECMWQLLPFIDEHKIQMLPRDAKAVADVKHWPDPDAALTQVAKELLAVVQARAPAGGTAPASAHAPAMAPRRELPRLLPDLCNRSEQDAAFDVAFRASRDKLDRRPFVFVLHGDDAERLHGFRERLAQLRIPRLLQLDRDQVSVEVVALDNPALGAYPDAAQALCAELGHALLDDRGAALEQLHAYLGAHQRPVMLVSRFDGRKGLEDLRKCGAAILDFWSRWPDLPSGRVLLHCLSVRFEADGSADDLRRLLKKLAARGGGFKEHPALAGALLPELQAVPRQDVETWAESREVRKFARIEPDDVAALYAGSPARRGDGRIPMEPLYQALYQLAAARRT